MSQKLGMSSELTKPGVVSEHSRGDSIFVR